MDSEERAVKRTREKSSQSQSEPESQNCLHLGVERRQLAWAVEALCYSFLSFPDLGQLYCTAHGSASRVARFLAEAKELRTDVTVVNQPPTEPRGFAMCLVGRFCRSLMTIVALGQPAATDSQNLLMGWLAQLILDNKVTLRTFRSLFQIDGAVVMALTNCPHLEDIRARESEITPDVSQQEIMKRITLTKLRKLRVLGLPVFPNEDCVSECRRILH